MAGAGCTDLSGFAGAWTGQPVVDSPLLVGIPASAEATLQLGVVDRVSLAASLTVGGDAADLRPLAPAAADALGAVALPDSPLRTYWNVVPLPGGDAYALVSLYPDDHVDLRLLRSDALYALFHLHR